MHLNLTAFHTFRHYSVTINLYHLCATSISQTMNMNISWQLPPSILEHLIPVFSHSIVFFLSLHSISSNSRESVPLPYSIISSLFVKTTNKLLVHETKHDENVQSTKIETINLLYMSSLCCD